ncbi:MAG: CRISPR-associated protein Cas4 [Clostridiales bacterium]|nr:CRISPR-associated protein Cas4 [Clostridiales bacterium]
MSDNIQTLSNSCAESKSDLLISGLQHFSFCRRQWALIHIEAEWADNYFTVDGDIKHEMADDPYFTEKRGSVIISRAMPIRSDKFGIVGKCDVVEFHASPEGVPISERDGTWLPIPVEYKRGKSKEINADKLQLCAQAICLEEMLCCPTIPVGYLYYAEAKRREKVLLDEALRSEVEEMLVEMRSLYDRGYTPKVKTSAKCRSCSLCDICLPKLQKYRTVSDYTNNIWKIDQ